MASRILSPTTVPRSFAAPWSWGRGALLLAGAGLSSLTILVAATGQGFLSRPAGVAVGARLYGARLVIGTRSLSPLLLLAVAALFAAAAEYLLTLRPRVIELPPGLSAALRPVWPQPDVVVVASACFAIAAATFTVVAMPHGSASDRWMPLDVWRNASGRPRRPVLVVLAMSLLLWGWAILRLSRAPTDAIAPVALLIALIGVVGSLLGHEWPRLQVAWRPTRAIAGEFVLVVALVGVLAYLLTFDLHDWSYSTIGDEHAFFLIARQQALGDTGRSLFAQDGAYGIIPVLSAFLEGARMRVFGLTDVGWKVATLTPLVLAVAATYATGRSLFNHRVGLIALGILATSHYLLAYGHSGYPNLEALLPGALAPLLFVLGIRRSSIALLVLAGLAAGLGWYTYYTSRTTIVILGAAALLMVRPRSWPATLAPLAVGFGLLVLPLFAVSKLDTFTRMFEQTGSGTTTEVAANRTLLPLWNLGRSLLAFNYNTHDGPWLSGSLLDPWSGALFVLGLVLATASWRDARHRLLLEWFGLGLIVTGMLSKYDYVSVSRLNFLLPVVALMCGLAADRAARLLEQHGPRALRAWIFPSVFAACVLFAGWGNLQRWFVDTPATVPTSPTSVAIRIVEDPRCQTAAMAPLIVDVGIGGAALPALAAAAVPVQPEFALYDGPPTWLESANARCVIFRSPRDPDAQRLAVALAGRWPTSIAVAECDRSRKVTLLAFYPPTTETPDRPSLACSPS